MPALALFEVEVFKLFVLVMARIGGFVVTAPVLGSANIPAIAKIGLSGLMAALITPGLAVQGAPLPGEPLAFALTGAGEVLTGMILGFVLTLLFAAIQVAGQMLDMQSGFGMINVFNPALETQFPVFGFFLFIVAVLFLFATNGHHVMIRGLVSTFDRIPVGGFVARPRLLWEISHWGRGMFSDGLLIAAPVGAALLVAYVVMGLLGRVVPQIQLFVVGFPLTIAISLLVMALSLGVYVSVLEGMFQRMFEEMAAAIRGMT